MNKKYLVKLEDREREQLLEIVRKGKHAARKVRRAQTLLLADEGCTDETIARTLNISCDTAGRTRKTLVEAGFEASLSEAPRCGRPRKLDGKGEALLVATACSEAPEGRSRWTLELLAGKIVELGVVESIAEETVRQTLKKNDLKPWLKQQWCIAAVTPDFVWRMEAVLDLYAQPYSPSEPVICFDETNKQLTKEVRTPLPIEPGQPARYDSEYERNGTANLFLFFQPLAGWRHVEVTPQRTKADFARQMKALVDVHFPQAEVIHVVLDNLNTHTPASLYEAFPPEEARRLTKKLDFQYTPKHGSWLNMAEMEFSVLSRQCLDRRVPDPQTMIQEVGAWEEERNQAEAKIHWMFQVENARTKLKHLYPAELSG